MRQHGHHRPEIYLTYVSKMRQHDGQHNSSRATCTSKPLFASQSAMLSNVPDTQSSPPQKTQCPNLPMHVGVGDMCHVIATPTWLEPTWLRTTTTPERTANLVDSRVGTWAKGRSSARYLNQALRASVREQTWPQNLSRTTGLVLQCRLPRRSAPQQSISKAIS